MRWWAVVRTPVELIRGKTATGEEVSPLETAVKTVMPLVLNDVSDAYRIQGPGAALLVAPLVTLGVGSSTYEDSQAATRRRVRKLFVAGEPAEARALIRAWNERAGENERIQGIKLPDGRTLDFRPRRGAGPPSPPSPPRPPRGY